MKRDHMPLVLPIGAVWHFYLSFYLACSVLVKKYLMLDDFTPGVINLPHYTMLYCAILNFSILYYTKASQSQSILCFFSA